MHTYYSDLAGIAFNSLADWRRHESEQPGRYLVFFPGVTGWTYGQFAPAVVDDFGNLVPVQP